MSATECAHAPWLKCADIHPAPETDADKQRIAGLYRAYRAAYDVSEPVSNEQHRKAHRAALGAVAAAALEEFAALQEAITDAHSYAMDDDDWDEHRRFVASIRNYAGTYRV